ncbi:hypothetical protein QSH57_016318 [Fusarium oxysporum f. sp. vasinfectum]|nr:hypothetical protein QSH57_016318 [Fusarium oxysporum f. sp. vasinfectum]
MEDNNASGSNTIKKGAAEELPENVAQNMPKLLAKGEPEEGHSESEEEQSQEDDSEEDAPKNDGTKKRVRFKEDLHEKHSRKKESHKRDPSEKHSHKKESRKKDSQKEDSHKKSEPKSSRIDLFDSYTLRRLEGMWNKGFADLKDEWLNRLHESIKNKRS